MISKDSFPLGIIIGIITPILMYMLVDEANDWFVETYKRSGFSERFRAILAVFSNLLPFMVYMYAKKDNAMRGVMLPTFFLAVIILVYYFGSELF